MSNLLKDKYPKIFNEINTSKTKEKVKNLTSYSHKKIWWKCSKNHNYQATISNRTRIGSGCPYCSNKRAGYGNDLKTQNPKLAKEWDYEKNQTRPEDYLPFSHKKVWWKCSKNHSWEYSIADRSYGTKCPYCIGKRAGYGNDLKTQNPKLAKEWDYEKNQTRPEDYLPFSNKKVWWKCSKNHSWLSSISHRSGNRGCPYCSGQKVGYGNDLKTKNPKLAKEWDYEKNQTTPDKVLYSSAKKAWWICNKGHSYQSPIGNRYGTKYQKPSGCLYCTNKKVGYGNDLQSQFPKLAKEWDYKKNKTSPNKIIAGSNSKFWWICSNKHEWEASAVKRINGNNCPYCSNKKVGYGNDLKTKNPKLAKEWDYVKNIEIPKEVHSSSSKKYWWLCKYNHSYKASIKNRTGNKFNKGTNCPFCTNQKVGYRNDLQSEFPKLAKEWDYEKNELKPKEIIARSNKKVWWICNKGHSWETSIYGRTKGVGCIYCTNQKVGYGNDLKTKNPELAKEWDYVKNKTTPDKVFPKTSKKFWWICVVGHSYQSSAGHRSGGRGCPYCTLTPRSREEVYLLFELKQFFNIDENNHKIKLKRVEDVDIKLANEKVVIEYDGSYWHKDKAERDKTKTKALEKAGWTVIRVREKPLKVLSRTYNVSSKTGEYKETANKVLKKLNQLGYEVKGLDKYIERKTLINKKEAEKYIDKLLKEKNRK